MCGYGYVDITSAYYDSTLISIDIIDNINELKFYESQNLIWSVKYNDIPSGY